MTDPIGQGSYKGLAVPLYGEALLQQQNSSAAIITMMHSTANTGRFLMGLDYKDIDGDLRSSVLTDPMPFDIDADGGLGLGVSGTTIAAIINSSGLYGGTTKLIGSSGKLLTERVQQVTTVAAATTGVAVTTAQSGMLFVFSTQATTYQVRLPASPFTGMYIDVYTESTDAAHLSVVCTAATHGFIGQLNQATSFAYVTTKAVSFGSTGVNYARFLCVSSAAGQWAVLPLLVTNETTNVYGDLTSAAATT